MEEIKNDNLIQDLVTFCDIWSKENNETIHSEGRYVFYNGKKYNCRKLHINEKSNNFVSLRVVCCSLKCDKEYTFQFPNGFNHKSKHSKQCSLAYKNYSLPLSGNKKIGDFFSNTDLELNSDNLVIEKSEIEIPAKQIEVKPIKINVVFNTNIIIEVEKNTKDKALLDSMRYLFNEYFFVETVGYDKRFVQPNIDYFNEIMKKRNSRLMVIKNGNEMIGAMIYREFKSFYFLDYVVAVPKSRGGSYLINHLKTKLSEKINSIYLTAIDSSEYNISNYYKEKHNFTFVDKDEREKVSKEVKFYGDDVIIPLLKFSN